MNKKLELLLVKKFPSIFKEYGGDMRKTCMAWRMDCGDGWYTLLYKACRDIQALCNKYKLDFTATQVKEKFGGLRFYYEINDYEEYKIKKLERKISKYLYKHKKGRLFRRLVDFRELIYKTPIEQIRDVVNQAEKLSYTTCEYCGQPGKKRGKGCVYVSCDDCDKEKK